MLKCCRNVCNVVRVGIVLRRQNSTLLNHVMGSSGVNVDVRSAVINFQPQMVRRCSFSSSSALDSGLQSDMRWLRALSDHPQRYIDDRSAFVDPGGGGTDVSCSGIEEMRRTVLRVVSQAGDLPPSFQFTSQDWVMILSVSGQFTNSKDKRDLKKQARE